MREHFLRFSLACPLRIEFEGAMNHLASRGDRREPIDRDEADRAAHLDVMAQAMDRNTPGSH